PDAARRGAAGCAGREEPLRFGHERPELPVDSRRPALPPVSRYRAGKGSAAGKGDPAEDWRGSCSAAGIPAPVLWPVRPLVLRPGADDLRRSGKGDIASRSERGGGAPARTGAP